MSATRDHAASVVACDDSQALHQQVQAAVANTRPVNIVGGNSKAFLGTTEYTDDTVNMLGHCGVVNYEPTELVVTVRAGTRLDALSAVLADAGQMLPFDPPQFNGGTIGGVLAAGLSGPRRPFAGSARDYVLGTRVLNGLGQDLRFGGEVMKNVAGYDVSRLQVGAFGTLGVLLDVSMKVLPVPEAEITVRTTLATPGDCSALVALSRRPLPVSATLIDGAEQYVRFSGSRAAVEAAATALGGDRMDAADDFWKGVRDHQHAFFKHSDDQALWRLSVPEYTPPLPLRGQWLIEWSGAQRWLRTHEDATDVFAAAASVGGHATRFSASRGAHDAGSPSFQPLSGPMRALQGRVRDSMDPQRLFNPGRFHPEFDAVES